MIRVALTIEKRRWISIRRRFIVSLPSSWAEVPVKQRRRWWRLLISDRRQDVLRAALGVPRWVLRSLAAEDLTAITAHLDWMQAVPGCKDFPIAQFTYRFRTYYLPAEKGQNIGCLEYALADELYTDFQQNPTHRNLAMLTASICRVANDDPDEARRRDDPRCLLHSRGEVEANADRLEKAPMDIHIAALLYFAGLKAEIHAIYKTWLFDQVEADEDDETDSSAPEASDGPNFGWWGIFQAVAEAGLFGDLKQVYQTSLHDVCIYLVRKRVEAEETRRQMNAARTPTTFD